jgi:hypothetical protein
MDDTESYHIQNIKWIKEYGTVPGLVHLHERFAFNSSWFSTIALFDYQANHLNYYTAINGTISVWLVAYLITLIAQRNNGLFYTGIILFLVSLASWPLIRGNATTANYDYITALIIFVLFAETIRSSTTSKTTIAITAEWLIWPAYLFTVRIINFPFLLLSGFAIIFLLKQKEYRKIITYTVICILLIIPFLIRNIILSGYPFYPSLSFDWFPVDWKADTAKTKELLHFIKYYSRVNTGILPLETTESMSFFQWVKAWVKYMYIYDKIIFIPGIIGLLSFPLIMRKNHFFLSWTVRLFIIAVMIQLAIWFVVAPDPRFIYGCLLIGVLLLSISVTTILSDNSFLRLRFPLLLFIFFIVTGLTILKITKTHPLTNLIYPYRLPSPPLQIIRLDNIRLYIPEKILNNWNPRCYDTKLPCLYELDQRLRTRGKTIKDGFKLENN